MIAMILNMPIKPSNNYKGYCDKIKRREPHLEKIAEAKETIKERHALRYEKEKKECGEKMKAREI